MTRVVGSYDWDSGKSAEIPLDANGWPTYLPFTASDGNQQYVHTITPAYVSGTYTVIVDGSGQISFSNAASATFNPTGGTNTFNATSLLVIKALPRFSWISSSHPPPTRYAISA